MNYSIIASIILNHEYVNGTCDWAEIIPSDETKKLLQQEQLLTKINGNTILILGNPDEHINATMEFFFCVRIKNQNVGTATLFEEHDESRPFVYTLFGKGVTDSEKTDLLANKIKYPFFKTKTCFGIDLKLLVNKDNQVFNIQLKSKSVYWRYRFQNSILESTDKLEITDKQGHNVAFYGLKENDTYVFTSLNALPLRLVPLYQFHLKNKDSGKDLFGCLPNLDTRHLRFFQRTSNSKDLAVEFFFNH
ncbi:MAG: hypothetical protein J5534_10880 [Fibrobacter sp.]|nr:hypothetical protein [Fibrobacter sp.]